MNLPKFQDDFIKRFGGQPTDVRYFSAPVSVTIAGNISAACGADALFMPLSFKTAIALRKRTDNKIIAEQSTTDLGITLSASDPGHPANMYEVRLIEKLYEKYQIKTGIDILYHHDIHDVSAAVIDHSASGICTAGAADAIFHLDCGALEQVRVSESAEQHPSHLSAAKKLASLYARKHTITKINTDTFDLQHFTWRLDDYRLIMLSNKKTKTPADKQLYTAAVDDLRKTYPEVQKADDITAQMLEHTTDAKLHTFLEALLAEQERIRLCIDALYNNDIQQMCNILNNRPDIHRNTLDFLSGIVSLNGVLHAMITDNDDIICFVQDSLVDSVVNQVYEKLHQDMSFFITETADGFREYPAPAEA